MKRMIMMVVLAASVSATEGYAQQFAFQPAPAENREPANRSAASLIGEADMLIGERRFGAARRRYTEAAYVMRNANQLPDEPLRRIANAYYFERRFVEARQTLLQLANDAAAWGDVGIQADATADAAYLAGIMGIKADFEEDVRALQRILSSNYLAQEQVQRIKKRLKTL